MREELKCQSAKSLHNEDSLISLDELWRTWIRSEGECVMCGVYGMYLLRRVLHKYCTFLNKGVSKPLFHL